MPYQHFKRVSSENTRGTYPRGSSGGFNASTLDESIQDIESVVKRLGELTLGVHGVQNGPNGDTVANDDWSPPVSNLNDLDSGRETFIATATGRPTGVTKGFVITRRFFTTTTVGFKYQVLWDQDTFDVYERVKVAAYGDVNFSSSDSWTKKPSGAKSIAEPLLADDAVIERVIQNGAVTKDKAADNFLREKHFPSDDDSNEDDFREIVPVTSIKGTIPHTKIDTSFANKIRWYIGGGVGNTGSYQLPANLVSIAVGAGLNSGSTRRITLGIFNSETSDINSQDDAIVHLASGRLQESPLPGKYPAAWVSAGAIRRDFIGLPHNVDEVGPWIDSEFASTNYWVFSFQGLDIADLQGKYFRWAATGFQSGRVGAVVVGQHVESA